MKILQIGLGSMGKRRIRNLQAIGIKDVTCFDFRADRREAAENMYGVKTIEALDQDLISKSDAFIISTPPDKHLEYIRLAVEYRKPAFIEASVIRDGLPELAIMAREKDVMIAPSCTLRFHPAIKIIKDIVLSGRYGQICNFVYHMGQYLPDWHPWEDIKDFYVSKRETSASREMVPFELTWILDITGMPNEIFAFYGKTHDMGVDIDDTYSMNLKFDNAIGSVLVDVVSRYATRSLTLNLERAQIKWNWDEKVIKMFDAERKSWIHYFEPEGQAEAGYNKNIIESMYIEELHAFINAVNGIGQFPNTLDDDIKILSILEGVEQTNEGLFSKGSNS